jgi:hypothetical protein
MKMTSLRSVLVATAFLSLATACQAGHLRQDYLQIPEENYDLLTITDDTCKPEIGVGIKSKYEAACKQMTEPRRYRGTWYVDFETSFFTPIGKQDCIETKVPDCVELAGDALPWPRRSDCPRQYQIELIGRRNLLPRYFTGAAYKVIVDRVVSVKRLPDPPHKPGECNPRASR